MRPGNSCPGISGAGYAAEPKPLLLDIRCPDEYEAAHIQDSINVPRAFSKSVDYGYEETVPTRRGAEPEGHRPVSLRQSQRAAAHTLSSWLHPGGIPADRPARLEHYEQPLVNEAESCLIRIGWMTCFPAPIAPEKTGQ